jgi:hypothetical protein
VSVQQWQQVFLVVVFLVAIAFINNVFRDLQIATIFYGTRHFWQ